MGSGTAVPLFSALTLPLRPVHGKSAIDKASSFCIADVRQERRPMTRKVKSVRVPEELESIDLSGIIRECERYLRDIESATLLKTQGNIEAAEALLKTRQFDLGRKIGKKVLEARIRFADARR
jgi:hypothetical protein